MRDRMIGLEAERSLDVAHGIGAPALLLSLRRPREILLNAHCHEPQMTAVFAAGQGIGLQCTAALPTSR